MNNILRTVIVLYSVAAAIGTSPVCKADEAVVLSKANVNDTVVTAAPSAITVQFGTHAAYPNVNWHAPDPDGWDWSAHVAIVFSLTNPAAAPQSIGFRIDDTSGHGFYQAGVQLAGASTQKFYIPLTESVNHAPGNGFGTKANGGGTIDTHHIASLQIFLTQQTAPQTLIVNSIVAADNPTGIVTDPTVTTDLQFLSPMFSDNMVLQRDVRDHFWGWTAPGTKVTVTLADKTYVVKAGNDCLWTVSTDPLPAGGPYTVTVQGLETVVLHNVMLGDVWLCSGQSNMYFGIKNANHGDQEVAHADYPNIRLASVGANIASSAQKSFDNSAGWAVCTPASVSQGGWGGFSAVGYFFGRHLYKSLNIPIGLITAPASGMPIESFISGQSLSTLPIFKPVLDTLTAEPTRDKVTAAVNAALSRWYQTNDIGITASPQWSAAEYDDSAWTAVPSNPGWWYPDIDSLPHGVIWYRVRFDEPSDWTGHDLTLSLGHVNNASTVFVNGAEVGTSLDRFDIQMYTVPAANLLSGQNLIAIRVVTDGTISNWSDTPANVFVARADGSGSKLPLTTLTWKYKVSVDLAHASPLPTVVDADASPTPTVLFNGMISPISQMPIKGVIWYQGEANTGNAYQYRTLMPLLIQDWRMQFHEPALPFFFVQLANYAKDAGSWGVDYAELREAQLLTAEHVPNSAMAVAIDCGDPENIHPTDKQDVGDRLALCALAIAYGQKIEFSGPIYKAMTVEGSTIRLTFTHDDGMYAKGGQLTSFTIAGSDNSFVPANAVIDGNTIVVSSPSVPNPVSVRYAWSSYPAANLYNSANLPASPFRTDNLREQTQP